MHFYRDVESFEKPLDAAISASLQAFKVAGRPIQGAEARTRAAIDELRSLRAFTDAIESHLKSSTFHALPGFKRGRDALANFHYLTVGPWRGVFLVAPSGDQVIAVVFSKAPHRLEDRLDEIAAPYRTAFASDVPE